MTVPPANEGLRLLSSTPPLRQYIASLWTRREFAWAMSAGAMKAKHLNTTLGSLWHILNPLLLIGTYYLIFGLLLRTDRGIGNFIGFLAIGIFFFQYSQRSVIQGATSIDSNIGLIRSLQFPRAILPIAAVIREGIALRSAAPVIAAIMLVTGEGVTLLWLLLLPLIFLQSLFNMGMALLAARMANSVRDLANLLPFVFRLCFYFSGVLFSVDRLVTNPTLRSLFVLNPFYVFISLPREYLMTSYTHEGLLWLWLSAACWTVVALGMGVTVFRGGEQRYGRG